MKIRVMSSTEKGNITQDFDDEQQAWNLYIVERTKVLRAKRVDPDDPNAFLSICNIHKCYHDENPPRPCEIIEKAEGPKKPKLLELIR